jgi:hypothetical protein
MVSYPVHTIESAPKGSKPARELLPDYPGFGASVEERESLCGTPLTSSPNILGRSGMQ